MRTRTKYDDSQYSSAETGQVRSATWNAGGYWNPFGSWSNTAIPAYLMSDGTEIIIDDITPSHGVKQVTHTKQKFSRSSIRTLSDSTSTNRYERRNGEVYIYAWGAYGKLGFSNFTSSYPKTVSQLKVEAMHKFHKANEVDTLLNLVESPQLISGAKSLIEIMRKGRRSNSLAGRSNAAGKALSSGFLAWSFGLAPLISDINKINAAIRTIKSDMDRYIRDGNRKYTVSAISVGSLIPNITASGYGSNPNLDNGTYWHVGINPTTVPTLRVGVRGRRNVEYHSDSFKKLDYVMKRFIATGPASLAWERIPFSFMLDWFVNLSGVVDSLDNALTGNSRHIDSIWMSEKWAALIPVYQHKYNGWTSDADGKQTALNALSYYHREAISPDPSVSLSGRFGKKQVALTAALLHQLVANLKVWR